MSLSRATARSTRAIVRSVTVGSVLLAGCVAVGEHKDLYAGQAIILVTNKTKGEEARQVATP